MKNSHQSHMRHLQIRIHSLKCKYIVFTIILDQEKQHMSENTDIFSFFLSMKKDFNH